MKIIGEYQNRTLVWISYSELISQGFSLGHWILLATSSKTKPDFKSFEKVVREGVDTVLLEFKGHGKHGEFLHDVFDEVIMQMTIDEAQAEIEITTTWHNDESLEDVLWQCFYATCLPETTDYNNLFVICTDLDEIDRSSELTKYINRFKAGWLPV